MKKTIVSILVILSMVIFNYSLANGNDKPLPVIEPITTLIIDANITVVLVSNEKATLQVDGGKRITELVTLKKNGDTLVIGSIKSKNLKGSGVIYVPASQLRTIRVNSEAEVRSLFALKIPKLDVVVNGACRLAISNFGELNITKTKAYSYEQSTKVHQYPAGVL